MKTASWIRMVIIILSSVVLIAPSAMATSLTIDHISGYYYGSGGEFNISGSDVAKYLTYYDSKAKVGSSFESFCLEAKEYVTMGSTHTYTISQSATRGGTSTSDPISVGTAWLYSQFAAGTLTNYNYTAGSGREQSAKLLQEAIWWLEGEEGGVKNYYANQAISTFGSETAAKANNNGLYSVAVLNMGCEVQDQLVMVPEPGALLLLGLGLLGFAAFRRWSAKV